MIGVSGGPDSVCLVRILDELREKYELELSLLHVNYGLRGEDSDGDEKFVRGFARQLELPLKVVKFSEKKKKGNLEEIMREFRYAKLAKEREFLNYTTIAVAHTLDDQVETFLMNLMRGAGMIGLGVMPLKKEHLIRPFLFLKKDEILAFLERIKQKHRTDQSNFDEKFFRNKIRRRVIPFLERECGESIKKNISSAATLVQQANSYIEKVSEKSYNKVVSFKQGKACLGVEQFLKLEPTLRGYVFRKICSTVGGDLRGIEQGHFSEFMKIVQSKKLKKQKLVFGLVVVDRKGGNIEFSRR